MCVSEDISPAANSDAGPPYQTQTVPRHPYHHLSFCWTTKCLQLPAAAPTKKQSKKKEAQRHKQKKEARQYRIYVCMYVWVPKHEKKHVNIEYMYVCISIEAQKEARQYRIAHQLPAAAPLKKTSSLKNLALHLACCMYVCMHLFCVFDLCMFIFRGVFYAFISVYFWCICVSICACM